MQTVYKYALQIEGFQEVDMPAGGVCLTAQIQNEDPYLWALVDPEAPTIKRRIHIYGTGHPVEGHIHRYISTFQMRDGGLVFHVFEEQ